MPHPHCSYSLEIGENLVREVDSRIATGGHFTSVAISERRVEFAYLLGLRVHEFSTQAPPQLAHEARILAKVFSRIRQERIVMLARELHEAFCSLR